jgi:hydroxymethylpyrimidine/phosphomethylpyrimidine kinase
LPSEPQQFGPEAHRETVLKPLSARDSRSSLYPGSGQSLEKTSQRVLLTIAGYDPSSGAGITADLQTFTAHNFFGISAITALTVQSTMGVQAVEPADPSFLRRTLDFLSQDVPPAGVKIGMLGSADVADTIAAYLEKHLEETTLNKQNPIVLDPVVRSSSGREFASQATLRSMEKRLLPLVSWITPNWSELSVLTGLPVTTPEQSVRAAHNLGLKHPALYLAVTGGDQSKPIDLLRLPSGELHWFPGEHIESTSTHGTGCAFSSALLCQLVAGATPEIAVANAKHFVTEGIRYAPGIGKGKGPLNLHWPLSVRG